MLTRHLKLQVKRDGLQLRLQGVAGDVASIGLYLFIITHVEAYTDRGKSNVDNDLTIIVIPISILSSRTRSSQSECQKVRTPEKW